MTPSLKTAATLIAVHLLARQASPDVALTILLKARRGNKAALARLASTLRQAADDIEAAGDPEAGHVVEAFRQAQEAFEVSST